MSVTEQEPWWLNSQASFWNLILVKVHTVKYSCRWEKQSLISLLNNTWNMPWDINKNKCILNNLYAAVNNLRHSQLTCCHLTILEFHLFFFWQDIVLRIEMDVELDWQTGGGGQLNLTRGYQAHPKLYVKSTFFKIKHWMFIMWMKHQINSK